MLRALLFTLLLFSTLLSSAQLWSELGSGIPTPDVAFDDQFGYSISMYGNLAAVGAPGNDDVGFDAGKVFLYAKANGSWSLTATIEAPSLQRNQRFGTSVMLYGNMLVVGAPGLDIQSKVSAGAVLIYQKTAGEWGSPTLLTPQDPVEVGSFGTSLAYNGTILAVGSPQATGTTPSAGAVYLFSNITAVTPTQDAKVILTGDVGGAFGKSVALNSECLLVGDPDVKVGSTLVGATYVYNLASKSKLAKLMASPDLSYFGGSISATEDALIVGGSMYTSNANGTYGTIFMFLKPAGGWTNATENFSLTPTADNDGLYGVSVFLDNNHLVVGTDGGSIVDIFEKPAGGWTASALRTSIKKTGITYKERFGYAVASNGVDLLVGSYNFNEPGLKSGTVFLYERIGNSWSTAIEKGYLVGLSSNAAGDEFGNAVDIDGDYAIVGARTDDALGYNAGAVYVFKFDGKEWGNVATLHPSDPTSEAYFGSAVAIEGNTIVVTASGADQTINPSSQGKVYVFEKHTGEWISSTETSTITKLDSQHRGIFGHSVDIYRGEIALTHYDGGYSDEIGLVYVFTKSSSEWKPKALLGATSTMDRGFGASLCYKDDLVAVGAINAGVFRGIVHLYPRPASGWVDAAPLATLYASDPQNFYRFGYAIDIDVNTVLVGSIQIGASSGAGYIFEKKGTWQNSSEDARLFPQTPIMSGGYGHAVALHDNYAVISSERVNDGDGRVLLFHKLDGEWKNTNEYASLVSYSSKGNFGASLALSGDHLIVGAPKGNTDVGNGSGLVEFYLKGTTVTHVTSTSDDKTYVTNDVVNVKVVFSQPIIVSGTPKLKLALKNGVTRDISFKNLMNEREMNFEYKVSKDDLSDDLDYQDESSLSSLDNVKSNITGQDVYGALPLPGSAASLSGMKNIVIDGVVVGIEEKSDELLTVYPNPFRTGFNVKSSQPCYYRLIRYDGTEIQCGNLDGEEFFTPHLKDGVYFLTVMLDTGKQSTVKIVKIE